MDMQPEVMRGSCTCCTEPRPMHQDAPDEEWAHDSDDTYAEVFHVHRDSHSVDCDGPMDHSDVVRISDYRPEFRPESKSDLWRKVVEGEVVGYGQQKITIDGEEYTAQFDERTDEGGRCVYLRSCSDPDCAFEASTQRDYFAEAMGY